MKKLVFLAVVISAFAIFATSCVSNENRTFSLSEEIVSITHQPFQTDGLYEHLQEFWAVKLKSGRIVKCYQKFQCMEVGNIVDVYLHSHSIAATLLPAGTKVEVAVEN